jgi:hypothetical protein
MNDLNKYFLDNQNSKKGVALRIIDVRCVNCVSDD